MSPSASRADGKSRALPTVAAMGLKPCWYDCFQKLVKSGGMNTPLTMSAAGALELADLRREVLGAVLEAAAVDDLVAGLREHRRLPGLRVGPGETVGVVRPHLADGLVGLERVPHGDEVGGDVLEAPEEVVGPREGLVGRGAAAEVVGLPRAVVGDAGDAERLGLVGDRVDRVGRRGDHHDVDAVVGDEVAGDRGRAVRVGLRVLHDELDRVRLPVAALEAVLDGGLPLLDAERVGLAERRQRAGERRDEADLDRAAAAAAAAAATAAAAGGASTLPPPPTPSAAPATPATLRKSRRVTGVLPIPAPSDASLDLRSSELMPPPCFGSAVTGDSVASRTDQREPPLGPCWTRADAHLGARGKPAPTTRASQPGQILSLWCACTSDAIHHTDIPPTIRASYSRRHRCQASYAARPARVRSRSSSA